MYIGVQDCLSFGSGVPSHTSDVGRCFTKLAVVCILGNFKLDLADSGSPW